MTAEDAPRPLAVLFGSQLGWSPARESQPLDDRCRTCGGAIEPGSRLYCAACTRTGFEGLLARQRLRAPKPRRSAPPPKTPPKLTRRDVRALRRTPEGREWLRSIGYDTPE